MSSGATHTVPKPVRSALWLSVPIAIAAIAASLAGLLVPSTYEAETTNWAAQGAGQDVVNLLIYPLLLALAWRAVRGSVVAFLSWVGLSAYSAYSYLLYAGYVHFNGLFPIYLLAFGLSTYALVAGLALLDPVQLRGAFSPAAPARWVGTVLVVLGGMFALLWLSEIVPAVAAGTTPEAIVIAGLPTNPVWVLDLGIVLPAMILAGLLLRRDRPLGWLLAIPLLTFGVAMGAAIVGMFAMLSIEGEPVASAPAVMISLVVVLESVAISRLFGHLRDEVTIAEVVRVAPGMMTGPDASAVHPTQETTLVR